jgi:hypothetical protein
MGLAGWRFAHVKRNLSGRAAGADAVQGLLAVGVNLGRRAGFEVAPIPSDRGCVAELEPLRIVPQGRHGPLIVATCKQTSAGRAHAHCN